MKKLAVFTIVVAVLVSICACAFQRESIKLEIENTYEELPEKNLYYSIKNLYSTHCYDSVTLHWTNPENPKFYRSKVVWENNEIDLFGDPSGEMSIELKDVIPGIITNFTIEAYDTRENLIDSLEIEAFAGHCFYEGEDSFFYGRNKNLNSQMIKEKKYGFDEYKVIPEKICVTVQMEDLCLKKSGFELFNSYTLEPYAISAMPVNKEKLSLQEGIKLCNELTCELMGEENCVYYSDKDCTVIYMDSENPEFYTNEYCKGFRLPSKLEWEFALRGGNPNSKEWGEEKSYFGNNIDGEFCLDFESWNYSAERLLDNDFQNNISELCSFSDKNGIFVEEVSDSKKGNVRVVRSLDSGVSNCF